jgi:hypothetical protein
MNLKCQSTIHNSKILPRKPESRCENLKEDSNSSEMRIGTTSKLKKEKREFNEIIKEELLDEPQRLLNCVEASDNLLELATSTRQGALSLQLHITKCDCHCVSALADKAIILADQLIQHPLGNYVLQKLMARSPSMLKEVATICRASFKKYACNPFSSRVTQTLIELDAGFCVFALSEFKRNLAGYIADFPSVFLVSVALKCAQREEDKNIFPSITSRNFRRMLANKYFKRVAISYLTYSDPSSLHWIYKKLAQVYPSFDIYLKDRYSVLILVALAEKECGSLKEDIIRSLAQQPWKYLQEEQFTYFVEQLEQKPSCCRLLAEIGFVLRSLSPALMQQLGRSSLLYSKYTEVMRLLVSCKTGAAVPKPHECLL